jgi:hypothetical protein
MKIDGRHARIAQALEKGLESGPLGARELRAILEATGATPAEVQAVLDELGDRFTSEKRRGIERLLSQESLRTSEQTGSGLTVPGRRVHDLRASKQGPWWEGVAADPLPPPLFPEPTRDIEVEGERFTKDDVLSLLRQVGKDHLRRS